MRNSATNSALRMYMTDSALRMPVRQAIHLRLTAERGPALVNEVVEHDDLLARAHELASLLACKPGIGVSATKLLLLQAARNSLAEQLEAEGQTYDPASANEERLAARAQAAERISQTA